MSFARRSDVVRAASGAPLRVAANTTKEQPMSNKNDRPPCKRYLEVFTKVEVEGQEHAAVAAEMGLKLRSVVDICSKVRTWMQRHGGRWERITANERRIEIVREILAARLEHQWNEVMAAWYRSKEPQHSEKAVLEGGDTVKRTEVTQRSQTGDVRYLRQALHLLEKICGLRRPDPIPEKEEYDVERATLVERRVELHELLKLYSPREGVPQGDELVIWDEPTTVATGDVRAA
jgi:hypothetical protein